MRGKNVLRFRILKSLPGSVSTWYETLKMKKGCEDQKRSTQNTAGDADALKGHRRHLQTSQDRRQPRIALVDEHGLEGRQNSFSSLVGVEASAWGALT